MDKQDFELLIEAGAIEHVVLFSGSAKGWEVIAYRENWTNGKILETARGEKRYFQSLDTAVGFVRGCGWKPQIVVDGGS
jgi:hypothetical protein